MSDIEFDDAKGSRRLPLPKFLVSANLSLPENTTKHLHVNSRKRLKRDEQQQSTTKIYSERLRQFESANGIDNNDDETVTLLHKLPVKRNGKWQQVVEKRLTTKFKPEVKESFPTAEVEGEQRSNLFLNDATWRKTLALKCMFIVSDLQSEKSMSELQNLLTALQELLTHKHAAGKNNDEKISVATASTGEVLKDIIPGYRIRSGEEQNADEQAVAERAGRQLRQETKLLYQSEQMLLKNYNFYLQILEQQFRPVLLKPKKDEPKQHATTPLPAAAVSQSALVAVQCMCDIMLTHPHFNFRQNILHQIIELAIAKNPAANRMSSIVVKDINQVCLKTLHKLFQNDKLGDVTLEAVTYIAKKSQLAHGKRLTIGIVATLLSVKVDENHREIIESEKQSSKKGVDEKLSLRERKRRKRVAIVEKDLRVTRAQDDRALRARFCSRILTQLFAIYFRVLKALAGSGGSNYSKSHISILSPVLRGVVKFGHMINVEFYANLFELLDNILKNPNLPLEVQHKLWCVLGVFRLLSGHGSALQLEPQRFHQHLLNACDKLADTCSSSSSGNKNTNNDSNNNIPNCIVALVSCARYGYVMRKKSAAFDNVWKFCRALLNVAMKLKKAAKSEQNEQLVIALMLTVRELTVAFPRLSDLLAVRNQDPAAGSKGNDSALDEEEYEVLETAAPCFTVGIYNTINNLKTMNIATATGGGSGRAKNQRDTNAAGDFLKALRVLSEQQQQQVKNDDKSKHQKYGLVRVLALYLGDAETYRQHVPPQMRGMTANEWVRKIGLANIADDAAFTKTAK